MPAFTLAPGLPRRDDLAGYMQTGRGWRGAEDGGVISRTSG